MIQNFFVGIAELAILTWPWGEFLACVIVSVLFFFLALRKRT